jgi:hypothetical protein
MDVVAHTCNPSTQKAEAGREFQANLGYRARSCLKNMGRERGKHAKQ